MTPLLPIVPDSPKSESSLASTVIESPSEQDLSPAVDDETGLDME